MVHKNSNAKVTVWQRGFKYTLTNGYTLSVAFGAGNYCDNRDKPLFEDESWYESSDFEVAVFEPNDECVWLGDNEAEWSDQVIGFVPAAALPMLISALKFWLCVRSSRTSPRRSRRSCVPVAGSSTTSARTTKRSWTRRRVKPCK